MNWQNPKTDWTTADVPLSADVNRWEGNVLFLKDGGGHPAIVNPHVLDAVNQHGGYDVNHDTNTFICDNLEDYNYITHISTAGRRPGCRIIILNTHPLSNGLVFGYGKEDIYPDYKPIRDRNSNDYKLVQHATIELAWFGPYWYVVL